MVLFEHVLAKPLSLLSVKRSRWIHAKHFRPIYIRESPKHDVLVHLCLLLIEESHNLIALIFVLVGHSSVSSSSWGAAKISKSVALIAR